MKLLPINERLRTAAKLAVRTRIFLDLWFHYAGQPTRPGILGAMNEYPEFFRFDEHAHFVSGVLHLSALWEQRRDTVSLPNLSQEVAGELRPELREALITSLSEAQVTARKVCILRSNLFAHRSAVLSYAAAFELCRLTADELLALSDRSLTIANLLLGSRNLPQEAFTPLPVAHLSSMLTAIAPAD